MKENEYKLDKSDVEIEVLQKQEEDTATSDGLRVSGMRYGSATEGDEIYVFETKDEVPTTVTSPVTADDAKNSSFKPLRTSVILLISCGSSFIITMLVFILSRHKGDGGDDPQQEESGDVGNDYSDN